MLKVFNRWQMIVGMVVVLLVAAGCFQSVDDVQQPRAVSQALPTDTPEPTATPTDTPTVDELPTEESTVEVVFPTETATPTETRLPLDVPIALSTETPTETPASVAQIEDDFALSATVVVLEVTQTVQAGMTMTASALGIGATETPFPTPTTDNTFFATPTPGSFVPGGSCIHVVQAGENLFRLSLRYGVSIRDIANASNVSNIQLIRVGQELTIPNCGTTGVTPTTGGGTGGPVIPGNCAFTHTVEQYETLFAISLQYNVPMASIQAATGILNPNLIIIGDTLCIPSA